MRLRFHTLPGILPLLLTLFCIGFSSVSEADTLELSATKDNTLINNSAGSLSNGTGPLFAGLTGDRGPGTLRALLAFDIESDIPAGSTITGVELTLNVLLAGPNSGDDSFSLHRVEQDWGEGTSLTSGGNGAVSTDGDATWVHTFFDSSTWMTPGGDFNSTPSAAQVLSSTGPATWGSSSGLVADVQGWLDNPSSNFGWILIGAESVGHAARQFDSRESSSNAPSLRVTFTPIPEPCSLFLMTFGSLGALFFFRRRFNSPPGRA